ncbi:MAG: carboxypeptidase regulatory-like domain-containing protein [Caldilineaceae bacterium]|nr:carboxypeptidase regulatory-like domain-containing protein [Caldilineaceae bacterium]
MDSPTAIRHVVNLAGVVQEAEDPAATNANHLQSPPKPQRLAGALVRILAATAPPAFQDRLLRRLDDLYADSFVCPIDADVGQLDQAGAPPTFLHRYFATNGRHLSAGATLHVLEPGNTWQVTDTGHVYLIWRLRDRLHVYFNARHHGFRFSALTTRPDHTRTQADGVYYFLDLPPVDKGGTYQLRVGLPQLGTRYATHTTGPIDLHANPKDQPVQTVWAPIVLQPTRITGAVTYQDDAGAQQPVAGALVRVRGDDHRTYTRPSGRFTLGLEAGRHELTVRASKFQPLSQPIEVAIGQTQIVDVILQREKKSP